MNYISKLLLLVCLVITTNAYGQDTRIQIQQETTIQGNTRILNCTGGGITCSITNGIADINVLAGQAVDGLGDPGLNGVLKRTAANTTAIAAPGVDYVVPSGSITGNADTATALAAPPAQCSAGNAFLGITTTGDVQNCFDVATQAELDTHAAATAAHGATTSNTANRLVLRDASGDFSAGTITANIFAGTATAVVNTPAGNIIATTGQGAINELDTEKQAFSTVLEMLATKSVVGTGPHIRLSTGSYNANDCVKVDSSGNFSSAGGTCGSGGGGGSGSQTLQDTVLLGRSVTDAVDLDSAVVIGGLTNKVAIYDGKITFSPAGPLNWGADEGYSVGITDHLGADIARFDDATKIVTFANAPVFTTGQLAVSAIPVASLVSWTNGDPLSTDCLYAGQLITNVVTNDVFSCAAAAATPVSSVAISDAYNTASDGTNSASAVGSETLLFQADAGSILSPLVTAGSPDTFKYNFASQATSNQVLASKTTSGAQVPAFRALVAADLPATLKSVYWDAGAITPDGTNCGAVTTQTLNSGPMMPAFSCADSNSSIFYGSIVMPPSWNGGTVIFTLELFHGTTESITFAGGFAAQCRLAGAAIDGTYGTAVAADASIVTANLFVAQATTAVTPNGTCTAGAGRLLNWKYTVDAANFSANSANTKILGVRMSYTAAATD